MFSLGVFEILMSEGRLVLSPTQWGTGSERVKVSVKNQKVIQNLLKLLEKWLTYKPRRFSMVFKFFWYCLTLSVPEKLKNSIFEMPIIPQTLNTNNSKITIAKSINLHTIRKLIEYSLENVLIKAMFTHTVFEILMSKGRLVLSFAQWSTESERVNHLVLEEDIYFNNFHDVNHSILITYLFTLHACSLCQ